jgi:serine/threonine-protein kinase
MLQAIGKYKILRLLGEGAMGAVYLAEDPDIGRQVAIKVMKMEAEEDHERFRQEARIVGGLSHPNIVVLHDFGFHEGKPYLVMQYLPGTSLEDWLRSPHALPNHLRVMEGLVSALDYAHGRGVLHRDLKPSNVQVTPEGDGRLMDFGIARVPEAKLTATGTIMGTPAYMAPEILGDAQYSTRADHYSAALVLYEMLAGKNPFLGQTISSTLTNVLHVEPPDLPTLRPDVPRELCAAITAHLAKDPKARPPDLAGLLATLHALRSGAPVPPAARAATAPSPGSGATQSIRDLRARVELPAPKPAAGVPAHVGTPKPAAKVHKWPVAALAIAVVVAVVWIAMRSTRPPPIGLSPTRQEPPQTRPSAPLVTVPERAAAEGAATTATASPTPRPVASEPTTTRPAAPSRSARPLPPSTTLGAPEAQASPSALPVAAATPPPTTLSAGSLPSPTPASSPTPGAMAAAARIEAAPAPTLAELSPRTCRRGSVVALDLHGTGFRPEHKIRLLRGGHEVTGLRITKQTLIDPGHLRVTVYVGADVPLGSYSLVLAEPTGALSEPVNFEVVL